MSLALAAFACASATAAYAQVPSPWTARDIGSPSLAGSSSYNQSSGTFTIDAGGSDIWGTSDQFYFIYQQISGDVDVKARVDSVTRADQWSKAGVMIRASLSANSAHAFALSSSGKGTAFQRRTANGGSSTNTTGPNGAPPQWVRLVRAGTNVTAYVSSNGTSWTTVGSDTIALGTSAYVGIAVTSHNSTMTTNADVSNVTVTPAGGGGGGGGGGGSALPAPLQDADIGAPAIAGSATYSSGAITINAAGRDIWDNSDQFNFVYQAASGDVDVSARVNSITNTDPWAKVAVMIRDTLNADARHASTFLSYANGYRFSRRVQTAGASVSTGGATTAPPGWVRIKRNGSLFTAYQSTDGQNWTVIGSDTITMGSTVYVGIAATSHNTAAATKTVVDNLSVTQAQTGNQPPAVTLTAPANGSTYTAPGSITLTATASDPEGALSKVEFYSGTTLLGTDTTSPYSFTWSSVPAGTYSLTAVAYDSAGAKTTSNASSVTVGSANQPPTVSLTAPANGSTFTAPASITVTASASDPEGKMSKVEFYAGTTLLNTDTTSPYSFTWSSVAAGTYSLTAIAYDTAGAKTTSSAVSVTVGTTTAPPRAVQFTASVDHNTLVTSYRLDIFANGANPNTATPVGSVSLGKPTPDASGTITSDQSAFFTALAVGTYQATVSAIGAGGSSRSAAVTFTR